MSDEEFAERVTAMTQTLYRVCYAQLSQACDREDAVQEALRKCWQKRGQLRDARYLQTWVIRVLLNECHNIQRRAARLAHGDARRYILGEEQLFKSDLIGLVNREKLLHARVNRKQSRRHRRLCLGRQRAILHQAMAGAIRFNHAIAHNRQPRIDAQDNHAIPLPYPMPSMIREKFSLVKKI